MKKIIAVIPITILFILLSNNINAHAAIAYPDGAYIIMGGAGGTYRGYNVSSDTLYYTMNGVLIVYSTSGLIYEYTFNTDPDVVPTFEQIQNGVLLSTYNNQVSKYYANNPDIHIYVVNGTLSGTGANVENYPEPEPPEPPAEPTWYDNMFEIFIGAIEGIASVATGGFSNLVEAFTEFWVVPVGGDEGDMFFPTDIVMASPTPTPTPIQYQTVIAPTTDPQGNVIYQYKYIYNNPSGTPIITSSPPINNNGGGDSFDYPYYENPDNNDNPYKLKIPWYLKLIFGNKIVDETTLDDSVNVIQDYMNDDNINDGVTTVYDGMSAIPTDWLILIGVIASIPLFGCLISRLLS